MAGILSAKNTILDTILTQEGRRQIADGKLKVSFYSFSDGDAIYSADDQYNSGSSLSNFSFQATNNLKDLITFEADDSGRLKVKEFIMVGSSSVKVINGMFVTSSLMGNTRIVSGTDSDFEPTVNSFLSKSLGNFKDQKIIGSPDLLNDQYDEFLVSNNLITFQVTEEKPIASQKNGGTQDANINNVESLFADKKLSHIPNYKYLPPVNKPRLGSNLTIPLGIYPHFGEEPIYEFKDLKKELEISEKMGYMTEISFPETSQANRLFGQFFEVSDGQMIKLDIIDFGIFSVANNELSKQEIEKAQLESRVLTTKHVYFAGKLMIDENGSHTFINLFTIVFEN